MGDVGKSHGKNHGVDLVLKCLFLARRRHHTLIGGLRTDCLRAVGTRVEEHNGRVVARLDSQQGTVCVRILSISDGKRLLVVRLDMLQFLAQLCYMKVV